MGASPSAVRVREVPEQHGRDMQASECIPQSSSSSPLEAEQHVRHDKGAPPAQQQQQRLWRRRQRSSGQGRHNPHLPASSPLLTHLAAKGFPLGKKPSAHDNFARVLRESLEQPHLASVASLPGEPQQQLGQQPQQPPQQQQQLLLPGSNAPPCSPVALHASRHEAIADDMEGLSGRCSASGNESDDEASSVSSLNSFCSCSSSLEQEQELWEPPLPAPPLKTHPHHSSRQGLHAGHQGSMPAAQPADGEAAASRLHYANQGAPAAAGRKSSHHARPHTHRHHHPTHAHAHAHAHAHHHHQAADEVHPAVEAFLQGSLSFAFSGGGFFFPYSLGCVIQLADLGIITDRTPLAGASCGAIIVACVNAGMDLHGLVPQLLEFAADCRTFGTAGRLRSVIEKFMRRALPEDAHLRCRGTTFLSLTKVFPYLKTCVISDYTSKEDLVQAIATSCHIPAYNDGSFVTEFRGQYYVDGGLIRHIPALPLDHPASYVAGVSCVPFKFLESLPGVQRLRLLRSLSISPDMFGTFPFGWSEVGGLVLAPAEDPVLLQMVEMGKQDVLHWVASVGLGPYLANTPCAHPLSPQPSLHPPPSPRLHLLSPQPSLHPPPSPRLHPLSPQPTLSPKFYSLSPEASQHPPPSPRAHPSSPTPSAQPLSLTPFPLPGRTAAGAGGGGDGRGGGGGSRGACAEVTLGPESAFGQKAQGGEELVGACGSSGRSEAAAAAAAAARASPWAAAKLPFARMAAALAMRAAAACSGAGAGTGGATAAGAGAQAKGIAAEGRSRGSGRRRASRRVAAAAGEDVGAHGSDDDLCAQARAGAGSSGADAAVGHSSCSYGSGAESGAPKTGYKTGPETGLKASGGAGGAVYAEDSEEEDLMDLLRWMWGRRSRELGSSSSGEDDDDGSDGDDEDEDDASVDGLLDGDGDSSEAETWVLDAAIAAANAAASALAGLPSAAASALSSRSKYVRAAALAAAMATAAAAHTAGLPVAGAAAAAAAAVGLARRRALRNMLQTAGRPPTTALRQLLVPSTAALRELLVQVGCSVPSQAALRVLLAQVRDTMPSRAALQGYTATLLQQVGGNVPSREALREVLHQARGTVPSREGVRTMLHSAYEQYVGGWVGAGQLWRRRDGSTSSDSCCAAAPSGGGDAGSRRSSSGGGGSSNTGKGIEEASWANMAAESVARRLGWGKGSGEAGLAEGGVAFGEDEGSVDRAGSEGGGGGAGEGAGSSWTGEGLEGFVAAVLAELRRRALKGGASMRTRWHHAQHAQRGVSAAAAEELGTACDEAAFAAGLQGALAQEHSQMASTECVMRRGGSADFPRTQPHARHPHQHHHQHHQHYQHAQPHLFQLQQQQPTCRQAHRPAGAQGPNPHSQDPHSQAPHSQAPPPCVPAHCVPAHCGHDTPEDELEHEWFDAEER